MFRKLVWLVAVAVVASACGGGDGGPASPNPNPNNNTTRTMSARIDGVQWTAIGVGVSANSGLIVVSGSNTTTTAIGVAFSRLQGTGTQVFGSNAAALGTMTQGSMAWSTATPQATGSVTLTTLTANRAAGTFQFTAPALTQGSTPSPRVITSGQFDVVF
jgi:hypothetical protein